MRVPGDWGVVLREGEFEPPGESESIVPFPTALLSELDAVFGLGISPRISEIDLCLIAPDETLVVIRSGAGAVAAEAEGVRRGVDTGGVTEDVSSESLGGLVGESAAPGTIGHVSAALSGAAFVSKESCTVIVSTSLELTTVWSSED
jgi:hypothetical protein